MPLIEAGKVGSEETIMLLQEYLKPMLASGIDHLVLGCTHYPYLIPILRQLLPAHVRIIDSGEAVARQTKAVLRENELLNSSRKKVRSEFYTNGDVDVLNSFLKNGTSENTSYLDF